MEHLDLPFFLTSLSQVGLTVALIAGGAFIIQLVAWFFLSRSKNPHAFPFTILIPGLVGLALFTVIPVAYELMIAFSDMMAKVTSERDYFRNPNFGINQLLNNLAEVFGVTGYLSFFFQTLLYALVQVFIHASLGLFLAHLVNRKIRFKNVYRILLTLPWAIPATIIYKTLGNETDFEYGLINSLLRLFEQKPIYFPDNEFLLFLWGNLVVIWASTPLVFLAILGGMQSIPPEYYEAAEMDGVRWGRRLLRITLPLLRPVMIPILFLDFIWTINNGNPAINMWGGPPGLSNAIYYYFNQTPSDYALGATVAFVSFGCLFLVVLGLLKVTGAHTGYETVKKPRKGSPSLT